MNVFGKMVMTKFLPEAEKFHNSNLKVRNDQKVKDFLSAGFSPQMVEEEKNQYVGTLFSFLDE
jgi:hypothetical protein